MNESDKKVIFDKVLEVKQAEYRELLQQQKSVLNAANKSDEDLNNQVESPLEYRMQEVRNKNVVIDDLKAEIDQMTRVDGLPLRDVVAPLALVQTDEMNFLITPTSAEVEVKGKTYTAISPKTPIYSAMEGKSKGDAFEFKGEQYAIKAIY